MKKMWIILLISQLVLSACTPTPPAAPKGPNIETAVAGTLQALTAAAPQPTLPPPAAPSAAPAKGIPVSSNHVAFTIPLEMNASAAPSTTTDVEFPYINPSGGPMASHAVFQITNYPVEGDAKIFVFKSSDYAAYGELTQGAITALLGKKENGQPLPVGLAQDFQAQIKAVSFKNGHGVRLLTQVLGNFMTINNHGLFYYYQGISNDGTYYVAAIFHINAAFLVADDKSTSPTPGNGIPFPANPDGASFTKYLDSITQKLNATPPEKYTVSLALLDQLIGSIEAGTP